MHRRVLTLVVVALAVFTLAAAPEPQRSVSYERYDVDIDVQRDGSLLVTETYVLGFEGEFSTGFAEIPLENVTDIVDVTVREGERPYRQGTSGAGTFSTERGFDAIRVDWRYEATSGSETRTFSVDYRVLGGLWVYPEIDWLAWKAVPADRSGIPTKASRVTVNLPAPVDPKALITNVKGIEAAIEIADAQTIVFESVGAIPDGTAFEVEVGFPANLTDAQVTPWQRRADEAIATYRWTDLDVDLTITDNGSLVVRETYTLAIDNGYLYSGYRTIPWLYLDRVTDIAVQSAERAFEYSETPCEYCYVVEEKPGRDDWVFFDGEQVVINSDRVGSTLVEWAFPALGAGETGSFEVRYTALGAVRVLSDTQQINWTAAFADRDVPVEAATVNLHAPAAVSIEDLDVSGGPTTVQPDGALNVKHEGSIPAGRAWSITIKMPADATTAEQPNWQGELERQLQREEAAIAAEREKAVRRARWQVGLVAVGLLLPIVGLTVVIVAWYIWGRDRAAPPVASYLTEPPSDLPPGIVAYLVDEQPTVKGALADLLHLATLGLISVDLQKRQLTVTLNWGQKIDHGDTVRMSGSEGIELAEHERTLFNAMVDAIEKVNKPVPFPEFQDAFTRALPPIYEQMGEMASRYFSTLPETARRRWRWSGQRVVIAALLLSLVGLCGMNTVGWAAWAPPVGLALVGLLLMGISHWMPQRTTLGIEEAARWRAFRRYLKNLKVLGDLEAAQAVLDRYFPYAVALAVDEIVLRQAESMDARVPIWTVPAPIDVGKTEIQGQRRRGLPGRVTKELRVPPTATASRRMTQVRPSLSGRPAGADASLQDISNNLSNSLNRASRSLGSLLNTAVGEVDNLDSPFEVAVRSAGTATKLSWDAGTSTLKVLADILEESSSGGGGGGFSSGGSRSSSWGSSSFGSRSSGRSSSRSSGGGSRGFG